MNSASSVINFMLILFHVKYSLSLVLWEYFKAEFKHRMVSPVSIPVFISKR